MSSSVAATVERECPPFCFSNDVWTPDIVAVLDDRLAAQTTPAQQSAALVVGSGGLPYVLSKLQTPRIFDIDLSDDVLTVAARRIQRLRHFDDWSAYGQNVQDWLNVQKAYQHHRYPHEWRTAQISGLRGDFARAKKAAGEAEFTFIRGDLRVMAPHIGRLAVQAGAVFTFVNFTNVANYSGIDRIALHKVLDVLPVAEDAVIVDSAPSLIPHIYSADEYRAL